MKRGEHEMLLRCKEIVAGSKHSLLFQGRYSMAGSSPFQSYFLLREATSQKGGWLYIPLWSTDTSLEVPNALQYVLFCAPDSASTANRMA